MNHISVICLLDSGNRVEQLVVGRRLVSKKISN
jgi:hypothetical protein